MRNLNVLLTVTLLSLVLAACGHSKAPVVGVGLANNCAAAPGTAGNARRPQTIPALQEWQAAQSGAFRFGATSRIVMSPDSGALLPEAQVLAEDLQALNGRAPDIVTGSPREGDISLRLGACDSRVGSEGYELNIGSVFEIQAATSAGVFYGTRTLLQLLHQGSSISGGRALDWPRYPERGLAIDDGNDFYTSRWIQAHVRELAYLKMNTFHLHFSDSGGFRAESTIHPEIVAPDHLSKQEITSIVALAGRYHINVVPEIDMPGHMAAILKAHPEFQFNDPAAQTSSTGAIDITNPAALKFLEDLIAEFLPLFPGPYWIIGGDEYMPDAELALHPQLQSYAQAQYGANANAKDAILGFFNRMDDFVRARGKTARVYNDELSGGSAVALNKDVVVEWWTDFAPLSDGLSVKAQALLDQGYTIKNIGSFPTYYNGGSAGAVIPTADPQSAYEHWEVNIFAGACFTPGVDGNVVHCLPPETIAVDEPRNLGTKVFVWGGGELQASIAGKIYPRLRVNTQKAWNSPLLTPSYAGFQPIMDAIGHAPGYSIQ